VERLVSKKEAARLTGYHPEHLMRLVRTGKFPKPIRPGGTPTSAVRFVEAELDAWQAERMGDRDAA
jgi:predicted DNA-binding transcriptional regulator AlpA